MVDCEFISEGSCTAVDANEEAKETRRLYCNNDNEKACCYQCSQYSDCGISCCYLGDNKVKSAEKVKLDEDVNGKRVLRCPICRSKMLKSEVKFRTGGWKGIWQLVPFGSLGELREELLQLQIHACPKCGKVEFAADPNALQRVINR